MKPSGAFGSSRRVLSELDIKAPPHELIWPKKSPPECCMKCRFWDRDNAMQRNPELPPGASCRRFPPRIIVVPTPVQLEAATIAQMRVDPRMNGQVPPDGIVVQDAAQPMRDFSGALDWCGEFDPIITPVEQ